MKIRNGFVSNSSSSSFVVSIPKDFVVTKDMVTEQAMIGLWENEILDDEDEVNQKALDLINGEFTQLKAGQSVYAGYGYNVFWAVQDIIETQDMIVMTMPGPGGDGDDQIVPFKDQRKNKR